MDQKTIKNIIEAALLAADRALGIDAILGLFSQDDEVSRDQVRQAVQDLTEESEGRGVELKKVASGYRYQTRVDVQPWVAKLWQEKPPRYSRALLETLALVVYRQPITRAEIEDVRGVSISSSIFKTLLEREWIKIIGHREVPGRPAMYGTTKQFLDYFNLETLDDLPSLIELTDIDKLNPELDLESEEEPPAEKPPVQLEVIEGGPPPPVQH